MSLPSESHRLEVVAEAKHNRKAIVWEIIGLAVVLAIGGIAFSLLFSAIAAKSDSLDAEKEEMAMQAKPETAPVDVQMVKTETIRDSIKIPGLVYPYVEVKTPIEVSGRVIEKLVEDGQTVKKGAILLRIDSRDYEVRMRRAKAALNLARLQYERTRELADKKALSISALDDAEAALESATADYEDAELALSRCEVRAAIDGEVDYIKPEIGEWLEAGGIIANIINIDKVKVKVGIAERDLLPVKKLDSCELVVESVNGGHRFIGKKINLSLSPAEGTQVFILELEADNPEHLLRPGMFVEADVVRASRDRSMMVMAFAIMATPSSTYEVAVVEDIVEEPAGEHPAGGDALPPARYGTTRRIPVSLGIMRDNQVEILLAEENQRGLRPGDLLVVNGQRNLDDGTPVRIRREIQAISEIDR